jgi:hypothetical protein
MLDRLVIDLTDARRSELIKYCKMENILLSSLVCAGKPKSTIKIKLETAACNLLQRLNKWLGIIINRLITEIEHSGRVQGRVS